MTRRGARVRLARRWRSCLWRGAVAPGVVAARADAAGAAERSGVLAPDRRLLRAERLLPVRQPRLQRGHVPVRACPTLSTIVKPGGVYLGVGPDQNFTYIVALEPQIAFITDIRRGNLQEHLMYKALFELSADRADFLSRLFSRKRPAGLGAASTAEELFDAYRAGLTRADALYDENLEGDRRPARQEARVPADARTTCRASSTSSATSSASGPCARPTRQRRSAGPRQMRYPTYPDLQMATDGTGHEPRRTSRSEENFRVAEDVRGATTCIVPIVGDFAGPKALRAVGEYLEAHGATVTAFYSSNVEQYLFQRRHLGGLRRTTSRRCRSTSRARSSDRASTAVRRRTPRGR